MGASEWLSDVEQRAWRGWIDAGRRIVAVCDRRLRADAGLTIDDYEVLVRLSEADDRRLRMSDLAAAVTHSPSRLSQRIDRLCRDRLVARERCENDARVWWVVLTAEGFARLAEAAVDHVAAVRQVFVDRLSPAEIEMLASVLPRLAEDLSADPQAAGG